MNINQGNSSICPKCKRPAAGMYCQSCGMALMTDAVVAAAAPKFIPIEVATAHVAAAVATNTRKHEAILADREEKAAAAYKALQAEHASLLGAHVELKGELSKLTTELANISAVIHENTPAIATPTPPTV